MNLALFDFDGTITTRPTFPDFVRYAVEPRRLSRGRVLLAPLVAGYHLGLVSGTRVRSRIVDVGFRGVHEDALEALGRSFAGSVLPGLLRDEAMRRIEWHRAQGDRVLVVSGALDVYLAPWCEHHGLEFMCSALEAADGVLTGRFSGAQCVGAEKPRRVLGHCDVAGYPVVYAYGDTREDDELLELAHHRIYRWRQMHPRPAVQRPGRLPA